MNSTHNHTPHSLRWKILRPLLLASAVVILLFIWLLQNRAHQQIGTDLAHRAELVANMISYASESISRTGELQRIVAAVGADRDILDIIVVAGKPANIIGSTKTRWLNHPLAELPEKPTQTELQQVVNQRQPIQHFNDPEHSYTLVVPLQLTHQTLNSGVPVNGAVMVQLDTRPLAAETRKATLTLFSVFLVGLFVFFAAAFFLIEHLVLRPVTAINSRIDIDDNTPALPASGIDRSDELGRLATTLEDFKTRTAAAIRELANQKFALDQHAIVSISDTKGSITYANDRLCAISGYTRDELLGKNHRILKSGRHPESLYKEMWGTITNGKTWHGEICNRNKNGEPYWVSSTIVPLPGSDGSPEAYISIHTDITASKHIEQQLQAAKEAADAANKAKSDFLATMSHEIRTPLNGVIGFTELLLGTPLTPEQHHHVELLRSSGENLLALINDILDLSKIEAGKLVLENTTVNFLRCVGDTIELLSDQAAKKNLQLVTEIKPDTPEWILGDTLRIRQVLLNLIGNAIKFTPAGGVRVEISPDMHHLQVRVIDTGVGLTDEQQSRIFRKFSQADTSTTRRFGGTGLGLVICKNLIETMGGEIGVHSTPGKGSTFWFRIPVRIPEPAPKTTDTNGSLPASSQQLLHQPAPAGSNGLPVLIVDDSEVNLLVAGSMLQALGYRTETAPDGRVALEMAGRVPYAAILMDYHMPVLDGVDATRNIRSQTGPNQDTTIIGVSASLDDRDTCLAAGMNHFLPKPFRKAELQQALANSIASDKGKE